MAISSITEPFVCTCKDEADKILQLFKEEPKPFVKMEEGKNIHFLSLEELKALLEKRKQRQ